MDNQQRLLNQFNNDIHTKEALQAYFVALFETRLIERARKGEDIKPLAEAINELELAFDQLKLDYDIKQTTRTGGDTANTR